MIGDIGAGVDRMVRAEFQMVVAEARGEATVVGNAALRLAAGALVATLAGAALLTGLIVGLTTRMPLWAASLLVGGVLGIVAIFLMSRAASRFPRPEGAASSGGTSTEEHTR